MQHHRSQPPKRYGGIRGSIGKHLPPRKYDLKPALPCRLSFVSPTKIHPIKYQTHTNKDVPLPSITKDAVTSLEQTYRGFALDAIRTHNSFGDEIIRYGYYPRLAAIQSRKRSASVAGMGQGSQQAAPAAAGAGAGGIAGGLEAGKGRPNTLPRPTRRMSTSELVCFDESSSEVQTQSEETVLESNSDSGSDGGDDDEFM